jgi:hypothetical protein
MWGTISVNLIRCHPAHPVPSWSEFLVQFGFPEKFIEELELELQRTFNGQAAITEVLAPQRDDGWAPICHVEKETVWIEHDPGQWEPWNKAEHAPHSAEVVVPTNEPEQHPQEPGTAIDETRAPPSDNQAGDVDAPVRSAVDEENIMCFVREMFAASAQRERLEVIDDMARALGYRRTGSRMRAKLDNVLRAAVRRGIIINERGSLRVAAHTIQQHERDILKNQFLASLRGRGWIDREDAIRGFARWMGFGRTGATIDRVTRSVINGLIREGRLESEGGNLRRV